MSRRIDHCRWIDGFNVEQFDIALDQLLERRLELVQLPDDQLKLAADCFIQLNRFLEAVKKLDAPQPTPAQHVGCICPPTSEQTCQNQLCPRKAVPQ